MTSYPGRHAELYDIFYADKSYQDEVDFIHAYLSTSETPVHRILELACGTGSHALLLEQYGYEIVAMDYSEDMLACAIEKANSKKSGVKFLHGDMRKLPPPEQPFDAVICLFDSIGYVQTNQAIAEVLGCVREQLHTGGLFIFEFWHAAAMLRNYEPNRVRIFSCNEEEIIRISQTKLDSKNQLAEVKYSIFELNKYGGYKNFEETQVNRYFLLQEMAYFLIANGFTPVNWFAGYSQDEKITEDTWHIVAVAKKAESAN